jgi:flavin-dependent thymidylate synthase
MKVSLIDYTGNGIGPWHAAHVLIFTKSTRLQMHPGLFEEIKEWPTYKIEEELNYMAKTIPSSWEFVHYTFMVEKVTRAFTHQIVRTRPGSYAQQTMRILDVTGWQYESGPTIREEKRRLQIYDDCMSKINNCYGDLIDMGANVEDARGVLPTNIHTNIVCGFNLRTLAEMALKRSGTRTQGEYREVLGEMISEVSRVHPWAEIFFKSTKNQSAKSLDTLINEMHSNGKLTDLERVCYLKDVDYLRQK